MMRKKQFTLEWFREFGWLNNPFRLEIFNPIDLYFAGYEREKQKLNYFIIENYPFGTIRGEKGFGKTMMLLWLKQSLQSYKGSILAVYYKADKRSESVSEILVDNLTSMSDKLVMNSLFKLRLKSFAGAIKKKLQRKKQVPASIEEMQAQQNQEKSIYEKLYHRKFKQFKELQDFFQKKLKNQRLVLLIDDAHNLSESDVAFISDMLESPLSCQAVITLDKGESNAFSQKDALKLNLSQLSYNEVEAMVKKRIEAVGGNGIYPFNEHMLHAIYNKAKKNPLHILKLSYDQAVKLSLKHLSDRKKGILPKQERPPEFDEAEEYRKLLEEERRKHKDPNEWLLQAAEAQKKELQKEKKRIEREEKAPLIEESVQEPAKDSDDYQIQVIEHGTAAPIVIEGVDDSAYKIKEVKKDEPVLPVKKRISKKKSSVQKKTRRKKSTHHHAAHKKPAKKKASSSRKRVKKTAKKR